MAGESAKERVTARFLGCGEVQFHLLVGVNQRGGPNDLVGGRHEMLGEGIGILGHLVRQGTNVVIRPRLHDDQVVNLDIRIVES